MTGPVRPVGPAQPRGPQRRTGDRRRGDERREGEAAPVRTLVPAGEPPVQSSEPPPAAASSPVQPSAFAAQMIGQTGAKKGLKGGPPVLDAARGAYLGTEYSGPSDRRPKPGKTTRTDV